MDSRARLQSLRSKYGLDDDDKKKKEQGKSSVKSDITSQDRLKSLAEKYNTWEEPKKPEKKKEPPKEEKKQSILDKVGGALQDASDFLTGKVTSPIPEDQRVKSQPQFNVSNQRTPTNGLKPDFSSPVARQSAGLTVNNQTVVQQNRNYQEGKKNPINDFAAGFGDVMQTAGAAATWLGANGVGARLASEGAGMQAMAAPDTLGQFDWKMLYNPQFYAKRGLRSVPFALSLVPAAMLGSAAGAGVAGAAGLGAFGTLVLESIGGAALSRPIESALEAGGTFDEMRKKGKSLEEANKAAQETFTNNLALVGLDASEFVTAFLPLKGGGRFVKALKRVAGVASGIALEGGEEVVQTAIQKHAEKEKFDINAPETREAFVSGGILGSGLGVAGAVYTRIQDTVFKGNPNAEAIYAKHIQQGLTSEEAKIKTLNEIAEKHPKLVQELVDQALEETFPHVVQPKREFAYTPLDNLSEADRATETSFGEYIRNNYDEAVQRYNELPDSKGGLVLNTDIARELSDEYVQDKSRSSSVHEPSSQFIKELYAEKLAEPVDPDRDVVLFTAGAPGVGKTTATEDIEEMKPIIDNAAIVYDATLTDPRSSIKKIDQALESGRRVVIAATHRDIVDALQNGALPRAERSGRTLRLKDYTKAHLAIADSLTQMVEHYKGNENVEFRFIDNSRGRGNQQLANLDIFTKNKYNTDEVTQTLERILEDEFNKGNISEKVYNAFKSGSETKTITEGNSGSNVTSDDTKPQEENRTNEVRGSPQDSSVKTYYHGTNTDFPSVDLSKVGMRDAGDYGRGFYVTNTPELATRYAHAASSDRGGTAMVKTLETKDLNIATPQQMRDLFKQETGQDLQGFAKTPEQAKKITEIMQKHGFDGVGDSAEVAIYNPEKITALGEGQTDLEKFLNESKGGKDNSSKKEEEFQLGSNLKIEDAYGKNFLGYSIPNLVEAAKEKGYNLYDALIRRVDSKDTIPEKIKAMESILDDLYTERGRTTEVEKKPHDTVSTTKNPTSSRQNTQNPIGTGKLKESRYYKRVRDLIEESAQQDVNYNPLDLEKDTLNAIEYIVQEPKKALLVAKGIINPPAGQTAAKIAIAMEEKARMEGNYALQSDIAASLSLRSTRMGQEIVSLRGRTNENSAGGFIRQVLEARLVNLGKASSGSYTDTMKEEMDGKASGTTSNKGKAVARIDREAKQLSQEISKAKEKVKLEEDIQSFIDELTCK